VDYMKHNNLQRETLLIKIQKDREGVK
jgi:hypothetical protein